MQIIEADGPTGWPADAARSQFLRKLLLRIGIIRAAQIDRAAVAILAVPLVEIEIAGDARQIDVAEIELHLVGEIERLVLCKMLGAAIEIGRASCRERVCQYG